MGFWVQISRLASLLVTLVLLQARLITSVSLDVASTDSVKQAAKLVAKDIMSQYTGDEPGQVPGLLPGWGTPDGYYWWVGGGLFGSLVNYWHYTGDTTWNDVTSQAILFQSAPDLGGYFEPQNESAQLGNDDISFWAFSALEAAEYKFPNPPPNKPQWLEMVQGVFNRQTYRWDNTCGGGLRWQVSPLQDGYNYKNSITNGCFFHIGARLARYTGNKTYADWAEKTFDWVLKHGLISENYTVVDGLEVGSCAIGNHTERWTYNVGVFMYGAATMWNYGSDTWRKHAQGLLDASEFFLKAGPGGGGVITELCEPYDECKVDQTTFKGYLIRWMRASTLVAPWMKPQVESILRYSAPAAAKVCSQQDTVGGYACGLKWYTGTFDSDTGIGQNMNAMEAIQTLLPTSGPLTADTGAISKGNASAGGGGNINGIINTGGVGGNIIINVTTADKAGASIVTIMLALITFTGAWWIVK